MLANNIVELLKKHENSTNKAYLARKLGINRETFNQILNGRVKNPGVYTLAKIADVLQVSLDELIGRKILNPTDNKAIDINVSNVALLEEVASCVCHLLNEQKEVSMRFILSCIKEGYKLSAKKGGLDKEFISWYIDTNL